MNLDANPYKGTRDFYPRQSVINWSDTINDQQHRNYMFDIFRKCLVANGFDEYSSSLIETQDAFVAKSGEDLGSNQLYAFTDKGDRKIALRPELTLSIARMVANKFENLRLPLRWFSIDNCFRYERPQKGRLREFWQCEIDIIGKEAGDVDLEIMRLTVELFIALGAKPEMYTIMYNHRGLLDKWVEVNNWEEFKIPLFKILDDWFKVSAEQKTKQLTLLMGEINASKVNNTVNKIGQDWQEYLTLAKEFKEMDLILEVLPMLYPYINIIFTPAIIRGQAYYTGLIFEAFDNNNSNPRSLFGGGRFDDLLDLYGKKAPAIGLAPGDTPIHEFMMNWNLYPVIDSSKSKVGIIPKSSQDLVKIYTEVIPNLNLTSQPYDIDYEYTRPNPKRFETLKKRGCDKIIEL
jgi:histidyl-tRNA synthetase